MGATVARSDGFLRVPTRAARDQAAADESPDVRVAGVLRRRVPGFLEDLALLVLIVYMLPIAILLVGLPIALVVRLAIEIASRI